MAEIVVLVTGGVPWDAPYNTSGAAAAHLDGARIDLGGGTTARVVGDGTIPVVYHDDDDDFSPLTGAGRTLLVIQKHAPDAFLQLGIVRYGPWYKAEEFSRNRNAAPDLADANGLVRDPGAPRDTTGWYPEFHHGDSLRVLPSTLPLDAMVQAIKLAGGTCVKSRNAGLFVCEDVFFHVMLHASRGSFARPLLRAGCLHVPRVDGPGPEQEKLDACVMAAVTAIAKSIAIAPGGSR